MTSNQRDIRRKLRVLRYAEENGSVVRTCRYFGIARVTDDEVELSIKVIGSAPIEKIDIFDGLDHLETHRTYDTGELGSLIRLTYSGAKYRGRPRTTTWDGTLEIDGNEIIRAKMFNNWNLDRGIQNKSEKLLSWKSVTTGNFGGIDVWLKSAKAGHLKVNTPHAQLDLPISEIAMEETVIDAGGLGRHIAVQLLPDEPNQHRAKIKRKFRVLADGDTRLYIRVQQIDGHRAWTSPIYLFR